LMVFQNGVLLDPDDYTATNGTTMTLDTGAVAGDIINMIGFGTFDVANTYTKAEADAQFAPITIGRKNLIINGSMDVAQRGTAFASVVSGKATLDRWRWFDNGSMVVDISQQINATVPEGGRSYIYIDTATIDSSIAAGEYATINLAVEGPDIIQLGWHLTDTAKRKPVTLSFYHAHTKVGTYCVAIRNKSNVVSYVAEYEQAVSTAWEKTEITIPAPTIGTWNQSVGEPGLSITFAFAVGSTYRTTADAWQTGNYFGTSNQTNAVDSTSNIQRLTQVQLEVGSIATDFEFRPFGEELALCQRYFEKSYSYEDKPGTVTTNGFWSNYLTGLPVGAHSMAQVVRFAVQKPSATYTVTAYSQVTGTSGKLRDGGVPGDITPILDAKGSGGFRIYAVGTSSSGIDISGHWVCDAEI